MVLFNDDYGSTSDLHHIVLLGGFLLFFYYTFKILPCKKLLLSGVAQIIFNDT